MSLQFGRSAFARLRSARRLLPALARGDALPADLRLALHGVPLVESLEGRQMLAFTSSASATLSRTSAGIVTFAGNATQANSFVATLSSDAKTITVKANAQTATYATGDVKGFHLTGGSANDWLELDANINIGSEMFGRAGNDTLLGGSQVDWIQGEGGHDWIEGHDGWDYLYAGDGNDTILGGGGNDLLRGHGGNDSMDGGAGTDKLEGNGESDVGYNGETYSEVESVKSGSITPISTTSGGSTGGGSTGGGSTGGGSTGGGSTGGGSTGGGSTGGGSTGGGSTGGGATGATIPVVANASAPVARITAVTSTTILAGQAVHVDALTSTLNYGQPTTARYEWDFGDAGSQYNTLAGYNAAHVYAKAGTYTVTLRVINEAGKSTTTTTKVTVNADTRRSIYVSAAGNDKNDGSTTSGAVKTFARAAQLLGNNGDVRVLFRKGDTFDLSTDMVVRGNNVLIGAYGSGDRPILRYVGARTNHAWTLSAGHANITGTSIEGLTFDSIYASDTAQTYMPTSISLPGKNSLVRDNVFRNVGYAVNVSSQSVGTLVQGNSAPLATGIRGYFMWVEGTNVVALGNDIANSTREHNIRTSGANRVLIYDNNLTNLDRRGNGDGDDFSKATVNVQHGSYVYVAGNTLNGPTQFGPLGIASNLSEKAVRTLYGVFEGNHQVSGIFTVYHGAEHLVVRNNVFDQDADTQIDVEGYNSSFGRGVVDLSIINNTGLNDGASGNFLRSRSPVEGIRLLNNLYVAPNLYTGAYGASPVQVWDDDMSNFTAVDSNNWGDPKKYNWAQGGINWVGVDNVSAAYQTAAEWNALKGVGTDLFATVTVNGKYEPTGSAAVVNAGTATGGVFVDFYGEYRDVNDWTIGAVQV